MKIISSSPSPQRVGVDAAYNAADALPDGGVAAEYFRDAAAVGEGGILQDGKVLHHTVADDVFDDLPDKINLSAVKAHVIQVD